MLGYAHRSFARPLLPRTRPALYAGLSSSFDYRLGDNLLPRSFRPSAVNDIEDYEEQLVLGLRAHVCPTDRVTIVGGGTGITTALAARLAGRKGRVTCYEASRAQLDVVQECCRRNGVNHLVDLRFGTVGSLTYVYGDGEAGPLVDARDLPDCDVLELDCEGAERVILAEMAIRPGVIIVETHGSYGAPTSMIRAMLHNMGYEVADMGAAESRYSQACSDRDIRVLIGIVGDMAKAAPTSADVPFERRQAADHPTSSVALCTFNGARFVEEQLRSILDQTRLPDEIVVFDDQSTDATVSIVEQVAGSAPIPIRITINAVRKGSTDNFLAAVAACRGEVIFLSDQDDVWCANKVAAMLAAFEADAALGLIVSDARAVDEQLRPLDYTVLGSLPLTPADRIRIGRDRGANLVLKRPFGTGSSMAFRRSLVPAITTLDRPAGLIHDSWILTVAAAYSRIAVLDETLNLYRQHDGQQVGAPPKWRANAGGAGVDGPSGPKERTSHRRQLDTYRTLRRSLVDNGRFAAKSSFTAALDGAILHGQRRLDLPRGPFRRAAAVLRELAGGRYRDHSSGIKSAGKDMLDW